MHFVLRGRTAKNLTETIFRRRILSGRRVHKEQQIQEEQKSFLRQNFTKQFWDKIWHNVRDTILRKQFNKIWPTKNCWSRWTPFFTWWEKPLLWPNPQKLFASDEPWTDWVLISHLSFFLHKYNFGLKLSSPKKACRIVCLSGKHCKTALT